MQQPNLVIFYVDSPSDAAAFYARLFGKTPIESSPTFAMFALDSGLMFGLWSAHTVEPAASPVGGSELAFAVDGHAAVTALHEAWRADGLHIVQPPTEMDFGYTFVALDADRHRLRVYAPAETPADSTDERR